LCSPNYRITVHTANIFTIHSVRTYSLNPNCNILNLVFLTLGVAPSTYGVKDLVKGKVATVRTLKIEPFLKKIKLASTYCNGVFLCDVNFVIITHYMLGVVIQYICAGN